MPIKDPVKRKESTAAYYEKNKEEIKERTRQWAKNNSERKKEADREYAAANQEKNAAKWKKWYEKNKELVITRAKAWNVANPERTREIGKQWVEANKESVYEKKKVYMKEWRQDRYKCKGDHCSTQAHVEKYKGYCLRCFMYMFPDVPITHNWKIKEQHVKDFLTPLYPTFTYDKVIDGGCSKKRPDWFVDCLLFCIIVECDENQHRGYSCESKRLMQLFLDLGSRPLIFIRFNPDGYTDKDGNKQPSSFIYHKKTETPIIRTKKEWTNRLSKLKEVIDLHMNMETIPDKEINVVQLFYDGY